MGQSNAGAAMCAGTGAAHSYIKSSKNTWIKQKKRKTLTLNKSKKSQSHFEASVDFSSGGLISREKREQGEAVQAQDAIPVLTAAVLPSVTDVAAQSTTSVSDDLIPVLDKPVAPVDAPVRVVHPVLKGGLALAVITLVVTLLIEPAQENREITSLDTALEQQATFTPAQNTKTIGLDQDISASNSDIVLVQNIVGLLLTENFSKDTSIEAFLSVWQQLDAATRATLNSSPWFLRFVFSLQKQSRAYLQSPDSYDANYNIKLNDLLKLAVAVGVMDQRGIQSQVEIYSNQRNHLVEKLKAEIATIENNTRAETSGDESIAQLNQSFRQRFAVKRNNESTVKTGQVKSKPVVSVQVNKAKAEQPEPAAESVNRTGSISTGNATHSSIDSTGASVVELDRLITRFVVAYEHGDLEMLESLFSPTARTNDKTDLVGIREDYKALFEASSFRILNLMDLRWTLSHNAMKGIGDYEIQIAVDEAGNARTLHGKIQFVVGKVNDQLRITRLYHLER